MSFGGEMKVVLDADMELVALLTGGIYSDVEEINRQLTPAAFDENGELLPCALIKEGVLSRLRSGIPNSVNHPLTIYFYQRQGYDVIEEAKSIVFADLNEQHLGTNTWNIEFDIEVSQQRDTALDCALGSLRFVAKRLR